MPVQAPWLSPPGAQPPPRHPHAQGCPPPGEGVPSRAEGAHSPRWRGALTSHGPFPRPRGPSRAKDAHSPCRGCPCGRRQPPGARGTARSAGAAQPGTRRPSPRGDVAGPPAGGRLLAQFPAPLIGTLRPQGQPEAGEGAPSARQGTPARGVGRPHGRRAPSGARGTARQATVAAHPTGKGSPPHGERAPNRQGEPAHGERAPNRQGEPAHRGVGTPARGGAPGGARAPWGRLSPAERHADMGRCIFTDCSIPMATKFANIDDPP
ncbi:hypothetical protein SAMN05216223_11798 [Actinacidiphila yanglinensis]|uniref:Uncharacterized protein n=1 Tax=Actinacidiphila yanglinensis TaxID=310779 RepID=A0A1H6DMM1_9ACTN|nr:hypothetical protein SAMN05216223_11798 [Actinacidiphila yanglinensis]